MIGKSPAKSEDSVEAKVLGILKIIFQLKPLVARNDGVEMIQAKYRKLDILFPDFRGAHLGNENTICLHDFVCLQFTAIMY